MGYDRSRFEILSPAGNPDKLRAAVEYGADAVYLSGTSYGLRAFSDNFNEEEMNMLKILPTLKILNYDLII
jgi:putative protease